MRPIERRGSRCPNPHDFKHVDQLSSFCQLIQLAVYLAVGNRGVDREKRHHMHTPTAIKEGDN